MSLRRILCLALTSLLFVAASACGAPPPELAAHEATEIVDRGPPADEPGGGALPPAEACEPLAPRTQPLDVFVLPEAGPAPFLMAIDGATRSLRVMVYQMGTGPILDALVAKAEAGLDVQVILDVGQPRSNERPMARLEAAGAKVIWSDVKFTYMHAKVIVADEAVAVISTGNYGAFYMAKARDVVVWDSDPADVDVLVSLFDADYARGEPDLDCTRLLVSPVNAKERLLDFIASAQKEVLVESMQLADRDVRAALADRKAHGVEVRALVADPTWIKPNAAAAAFLAEHGIATRHLKVPSVHTKAILVDAEVAYVGSINLSATSLTRNREVGLLVTEQENVATLRATFEDDWQNATPF
jgi:cardiolipin synthase A/B